MKRVVAGWLIESIDVLGSIEMRFDTPLKNKDMEIQRVRSALSARVKRNPDYLKLYAEILSNKAEVNVTEIN